MKRYDEIQLLTFPIIPESTGFDNFAYKTLKFPQKWRNIINDLRDAQKYIPEWQPKRIALNELTKSVFPELVAVESSLYKDVWLYGTQEISAPKIRQLVNAWFWSNNPKTLERRRDIATKVDEILVSRPAAEDELIWEDKTINLSEIKTNKWNTAEFVNAETYKLLPELLARSLTGKGNNDLRRTLPLGGKELQFLRTSPLDKGVELISWTPFEYKNHFYSVVITIVLQLAPFQNLPKIAINFGIRRWVSKNEANLGRGNHTVFLLSKLDGKCPVENGHRFQKTTVHWGKDESGFHLQWIQAFAELQKNFLGAAYLPDLSEFHKDPSNFINQDKTKMLMVFDNRMFHDHEIRPGLPAVDKGSLFNAVKGYFKTDFNLSPSAPVSRCRLPSKSKIGFGEFYRDDSGNKFVANEIFDGTKPKKEKEEKNPPKLNEGRMRELCRLRREYLAKSVGLKYHLEIWWNNDFVRDEIIKQIREILGLKYFDLEKEDNEINIWRTPEIEIQIIVKDLGNLAESLVFDESLENESQENGFDRRVNEICRIVSKSAQPIPTIIEIESKGEFQQKRRNSRSKFDLDPKSALRIGFARQGRLAQFINTPSANTKKGESHLANQAYQAFLDSLRQIGLIGGLPIGKGSENNWVNSVNFAAVWILRKKEKGQRKIIPIIVFIKREEETDKVFATAFGLNEFLPYKEFLIKMAERNFSQNWLNDSKGEALKIEQFFRDTIEKIQKQGNLLLLAETQNTRLKWVWLQDGNLTQNSLSFDICQTFEDFSNWQNLRFVRVRTSEQNEIPSHIVPNVENQSYGNSKGVFRANDKVFYTAAERSGAMQKAKQYISKAVNPTMQVWNANLLEIIPCFLQTGDSPEEFAYLTHILRGASVNFSNEYQMPLPLHLAELTKEFIPDFALEEQEG